MSVCLIESINICSQIKVIVGHSDQKPVALCTTMVARVVPRVIMKQLLLSDHFCSQRNLSLMAGSSTINHDTLLF